MLGFKIKTIWQCPSYLKNIISSIWRKITKLQKLQKFPQANKIETKYINSKNKKTIVTMSFLIYDTFFRIRVCAYRYNNVTIVQFPIRANVSISVLVRSLPRDFSIFVGSEVSSNCFLILVSIVRLHENYFLQCFSSNCLLQFGCWQAIYLPPGIG